jgi:hypothetical protein
MEVLSSLSRTKVQKFCLISSIRPNAIHFSCYLWNVKCAFRLVTEESHKF